MVLWDPGLPNRGREENQARGASGLVWGLDRLPQVRPPGQARSKGSPEMRDLRDGVARSPRKLDTVVTVAHALPSWHDPPPGQEPCALRLLHPSKPLTDTSPQSVAILLASEGTAGRIQGTQSWSAGSNQAVASTWPSSAWPLKAPRARSACEGWTQRPQDSCVEGVVPCSGQSRALGRGWTLRLRPQLWTNRRWISSLHGLLGGGA